LEPNEEISVDAEYCTDVATSKKVSITKTTSGRLVSASYDSSGQNGKKFCTLEDGPFGRGAGRIPDKSACPEGMRDDGTSCWLDTYGRGAGTTPIARCPSGQEWFLSGCYGAEYDHNVWERTAVCTLKKKGSEAWWNFGAGELWTDCNLYGHKSMPELVCESGDELYGLLCYPRCRSGYRAVGCCLCEPEDGPGGIRVTLMQRQHCGPNEELNGGLCYPKCPVGYYASGCCICTPDSNYRNPSYPFKCGNQGSFWAKTATDCSDGAIAGLLRDLGLAHLTNIPSYGACLVSLKTGGGMIIAGISAIAASPSTLVGAPAVIAFGKVMITAGAVKISVSCGSIGLTSIVEAITKSHLIYSIADSCRQHLACDPSVLNSPSFVKESQVVTQASLVLAEMSSTSAIPIMTSTVAAAQPSPSNVPTNSVTVVPGTTVGDIVKVTTSNTYLYVLTNYGSAFRCNLPCTGQFTFIGRDLLDIDASSAGLFGVNTARRLFSCSQECNDLWSVVPGGQAGDIVQVAATNLMIAVRVENPSGRFMFKCTLPCDGSPGRTFQYNGQFIHSIHSSVDTSADAFAISADRNMYLCTGNCGERWNSITGSNLRDGTLKFGHMVVINGEGKLLRCTHPCTAGWTDIGMSGSSYLDFSVRSATEIYAVSNSMHVHRIMAQ
jgi:hypothetical protein